MIETHTVAVLIVTLAIGTIGVFAEILTECPATDPRNTTVFVVHETDRSKYYRCYNGEKILMECALTNTKQQKLHFNPVLQVCGLSNNVDGKDGKVEAVFMRETLTEIVSDTEDEVTTVIVPTECSSHDSIYAVHLAHESDCNLFYICRYGNKVLRRCPLGLHFNAVLQVCDWPDNAGCSNYTTGIKVDEVNDTAVQSGKCSAGSPAHISHEFNCELYYTCDHGNKVLQHCPTGLHFNTALQICDWQYNAGCSNFNDTESTVDDNTSGNNTCSSGNADILHIPHESNCRLFYTCSNGIKVLRRCPSILHFNAVLQVCDWPENAGCSTSDTNDSKDEEEEKITSTIVPNQSSVSDVDETEKTTITATASTTDSFENTNESSTAAVSSPNETTQSNVDVTDKATTKIVPGEVTEPTTKLDNSTTNVPKKCLSTKSNDTVSFVFLLPHESDCHLYYICINGELILQECPPGLHFSVNQQRCNWPEQVGCSSSNENGTESGNEVSTEVSDTSPAETNECPPNSDSTLIHLPHETDCGLFYKCAYGQKVPQQCPPGLHFNAQLNVCDWPEQAGCSYSNENGTESGNEVSTEENDTSTAGSNECPPDSDSTLIHLPHETDCGLFYKCAYGQKVPQQCPPGLHFNAQLNVCDWPEQAGCSYSNENGTESGNEVSTEVSDTSPAETNECPPNSDNTLIHLPHETDCGLFYKCDYGQKVPQQCPPGLHFNAQLNVCDWPEQAGCSYSNENGTESGNEVSTEENDTSTAGSNECPPDSDSTLIHLPHETDCGLFYKCAYGQKVPQQCPPGLHFNAQLNVCDWPEQAGCSYSNENGTESGNEVSTEVNDTSPAETNECPPNSDSTLIHLPHETDCGLFYKCAYGQKVPQQCPPGLHFNAQLNVCDWPEQAGCSYSNENGTESGNEVSTEVNDTSPAETNECPPNSDSTLIHLPHETDCGLFYKCAYGQKVPQQCPPGLHFNAQLNVCDWPEQAGCSSSNENGTESGNEVSTEENDTSTVESNECPPESDSTLIHLPHETDCSLFYKCAYGQKVPQQCPPGLHFNAQLNVCDWPENATCESSTEEPNNSSTDAAEDGQSSVGPVSGSEYCIGNCPNEDPPILVLLPHEDCSKFCKCSNGVPYVYRCPSGLHFNTELLVCDYREDAVCEEIDVSSSTIDFTISSSGNPITPSNSEIVL